MLPSIRRALQAIGVALFLTSVAPAPLRFEARAETSPRHVQELKNLQQARLLKSARARLERYRALRKARGAKAEALRARTPKIEGGELQASAPKGAAAVDRVTSVAAIAPNRLASNPAGDVESCGSPIPVPCSCQSEVSIAAFGNKVVAAWNDGEGFGPNPPIGSTQGFAYSADGGVTWTDGGTPPTTNVGRWDSDPVVAVNEKTGDFYFCALVTPSAGTNGIGVVKGTFTGNNFAWQTPTLARSVSDFSAILDKQWLAVDSSATPTRLYLSYTTFTVTSGSITNVQIQFQRSTNDNGSWFSAATISDPVDNGRVQGSRPVAGPRDTMYVTWFALGSTALDIFRIKKSVNGGSTFGSQFNAGTFYANYGSGAPGFNRGTGVNFPSIAVDRSTGARRGRVYVAWNESINFYDDNLGFAGNVNESEPNGTPAQADAFTMGQQITGTITSGSEFDFFSFSGVQGQTVIAYLDTILTSSTNLGLRLFCSNGTTSLALSETGSVAEGLGKGLIVFTLPTTATYYLRVGSFSGVGTYTIQTGLNGIVLERARDHRDVFVATSNNGTAWNSPVRANIDDSGFLDNWLPEVAVSSEGKPYVAWYDFRDAQADCGGRSGIYMARSEDGGVSYTGGSPVTEVQTNWTSVSSNVAPNQGDYIGLFANNNAAYVGWADGRNGTPDVFVATVGLAYTPALVSLASVLAEPGQVTLTWFAPSGDVRATVYRRLDSSDWSPLAEVTSDGTGQIRYVDRDVVAGTRYGYRLGIREGSAESFAGEVWVDVPARLELAIQGVRPNPTAGDIWVSLSLPGPGPATLELLDITGRRLRIMEVGGLAAQAQIVNLGQGERIPVGIYVVRLSRAGQSATARVSVVR